MCFIIILLYLTPKNHQSHIYNYTMSTSPAPNCFGCGRRVSSIWRQYQKLLHEDWEPVEAMKQFPQLKRRCCKMRLIGAVDNMNEQANYLPQQRVSLTEIESMPQPTTAFLRPEQIAAYFPEFNTQIQPPTATQAGTIKKPSRKRKQTTTTTIEPTQEILPVVVVVEDIIDTMNVVPTQVKPTRSTRPVRLQKKSKTHS